MKTPLENPLNIDLETDAAFKKLMPAQQTGARIALEVLKKAQMLGLIDMDGIHSIADFGAMLGGPTFTLTRAAEDVDAFELNPGFAQFIMSSGILPPEKVFTGDGIAHLSSSTKPYDLVTSFMHGPDPSGDLFLRLAHVCTGRLTDQGHLLLTFAHRNETHSLDAVQALCSRYGVQSCMIEGYMLGEQFIPPCIIISKSELIKL